MYFTFSYSRPSVFFQHGNLLSCFVLCGRKYSRRQSWTSKWCFSPRLFQQRTALIARNTCEMMWVLDALRFFFSKIFFSKKIFFKIFFPKYFFSKIFFFKAEVTYSTITCWFTQCVSYFFRDWSITARGCGVPTQWSTSIAIFTWSRTTNCRVSWNCSTGCKIGSISACNCKFLSFFRIF